jgi:hypothetical protein
MRAGARRPRVCQEQRFLLTSLTVSARFKPPSPEAVARVRAFAERRLTPEEFQAWVDAPMSDAEREEIQAQIAWFKRRYPTARERLAYARRMYAQWVRK